MTHQYQIHKRYRVIFGKNDRFARHAQLTILKPYRKSGIFQLLVEAAHSAVILSNRLTVGWLLYPAARVRS